MCGRSYPVLCLAELALHCRGLCLNILQMALLTHVVAQLIKGALNKLFSCTAGEARAQYDLLYLLVSLGDRFIADRLTTAFEVNSVIGLVACMPAWLIHPLSGLTGALHWYLLCHASFPQDTAQASLHGTQVYWTFT
jgi:hypothetical protein